MEMNSYLSFIFITMVSYGASLVLILKQKAIAGCKKQNTLISHRLALREPVLSDWRGQSIGHSPGFLLPVN